ncbi:AEC family transporter [Shewanella fidelis]|uniref:AEC family transporter n=1 Tax=Shewanella fidelis TaxID=173509 RepID=A0AAW8NL18_9GAMM|nr:AEC family transporter [Shewanella fidelis]MDR8523552.1 AEC family transporter [Shewanella fidelis]MDW4810099.1 AEC family transporter [Shewanella fidelis]MDW4814244.1 AEC family transporter [Shewanella fidelis]MDW4822275.1 AEC family transporter [Shewanella fidelis]MDW4826366.1 AEC family transporter [Shewanella fidelis]
MSTLSIIVPLLFMASLGYFVTAKGPFSKEHIGGISLFTFYLSIPAFLFCNMYKADLVKSFALESLLAFYLPVLAIFAIGSGLYYWLKDNGASARSPVFGLSCSYSNTILVGLPLIVGALGEAVMGNVFAIITFHSALLFAMTFLLSARFGATAHGLRSSLKGIVVNPIVLSITFGLILNLFNVPLNDELFSALSLLSQPALACALFVLGANLSFYKITKDWHFALVATLIKLILLPLCVYVAGHYLLDLDSTELAIVVLLSASPLGVNAYLIAMQVQALQPVVASTVVLSTLLSTLTMSIWLTILL